jgi:hypothetical protein
MSAKRPTPPAVAHPWEFKARFRRHAFGWKSQPAITRVKQAVAEVKKVAKKNPAAAAALDWATLLRLVMQRWRTERVYEDLKDCHLAASLSHLSPLQPPTRLTQPAGSPRSTRRPLTQEC